MKLLASPFRRFVLLAPAQRVVAASFARVQCNSSRYQDLLFGMQKLRGRVYLEDGAIQPSQLECGRHSLGIDDDSWHLLILDADQEVRGCIRCREYSASVNSRELTISHSALARSFEWRRPLENAVQTELALARRLGCRVVEIGGLALDRDIRGTSEALRMALGIYALCQQLGGAVGLST